jgi:hypothetical protein
MPDQPSGSYKVSCAQKHLDHLRALVEKASALGIREEFLSALKAIDHKLTSEPLTWGDPQYHLSNLGLLFCHGIYSMLHVYYAVSEERRIVFIKEILALPNCPLGEGG